jgi:hypothetical protein
MKLIYKNILATVIGVTLASPVMAEEHKHDSCGDKESVSINEMGIVNEALLQQHIDKTKGQMERVRHLSGPQVAQHKREMKQHLTEMDAAMQLLHNLMYAEGCEASLHGASAEVRLQVVEKRLDMMQQMMEQVINHISEQEK